MKISDKPVEHLEFKSGINEDIRPSLADFYAALTCGNCFKRSAACCSDRNNPSPICLCFVYEISRFLRQLIVLGVHVMICNVVHLYRTEGTKSDVKGYETNFYTLLFCLFEKLLCEMKSCGRSCSGTKLT